MTDEAVDETIRARAGTFTPESDTVQQQVRSSTLLLAGQAIAVLVNLATQVLLVRYLTKSDFGAFAYALSVVTLGETVAGFGLSRGVSRFVPIYDERGEFGKALGTLVFAFVAVLGLGLSVVLLVIGLRGVVMGQVVDAEDATALLAVLIVLAPVQALGILLDSVYAIFGRPRLIFARNHVFTPFVRLAVTALVAASGASVLSIGVGFAAAGVFGLLVYAVLLKEVLRSQKLLPAHPLRFPVREMLSFTVPLLTNDVVGVLMNAAATIILGVIAGSAEVATLRAVLPIALTMTYVLYSFGVLFVPLASRLFARRAYDELNRLYWQTAAWSAVFALPILLAGLVFADDVTRFLFGDRYADAGAVLAILVVGHYVTAAMGPNGVLLGVFHEVRFIVWTNVFAVALNLALAAALVPAAGALGAAVAMAATLVVLNVVRQIGLARRTPVTALDRELVGLYLAVPASVIALAVVEALLSPPLGIGIGFVVAIWIAVLLFARRQLDFAETFPEVNRIPGLRRLFGTGMTPPR